LVSDHCDRSIVTLVGSQGQPRGLGVLVGERHILTCAHAVNVALKRPKEDQSRPGDTDEVQIRFPLLAGEPRRFATVVVWHPPPRSGVGESGMCDIAGLILTGEGPPAESEIARVSATSASGAVSVFGYPQVPVRPAGGWVSGQLLGAVGGGRVQLDSDIAGALRAQPGYSGSPVWDQESGLVVGMFVAGSLAGLRDGYIVPAESLCAAWPDQLADRTIPPCPYRGLSAFTEADAEYFVGRERDTELLRAKVSTSPLVLVVGSSGVGKSSLVQAGLCAQLRTEGWAIASCRPGGQPFEAIAAELLRLDDPHHQPQVEKIRQWAKEIKAGGLLSQAKTLSLACGQRILLVVDQLEELFRPDNEPALPESVLDVLLAHAELALLCPLRVVATVRADFYPRILEHPNVGTRLADKLVQLSPLGLNQLHRAVVEPAARVGVRVPESLANIMVEHATSNAGALPLLEFALTALWPHQRGRVLDADAYYQIGGVTGGVGQRADIEIERLVGEGLKSDDINRALLKLVSSLGGGLPVTRRTCPRTELTDEELRVVERMAAARLVTADADLTGTPTYELANESLITAWPTMAKLVEAGQDFLRWRSRIERWIEDTGGQHLPEAWIAEAKTWCADRPSEIGEAIRNLVMRSETEHSRRLREVETARDEARRAAEMADALRLAAQAELAARTPGGLTAALVLGTESLRLQPTFEGDSVIRRLLALAARPVSQFIHDDVVGSVAFSPDGLWVATASHDGTARIFNTTTGKECCRLTHNGPVRSVTFNPDGHWVATASNDGTTRVFHAPTGTERCHLIHNRPVMSVAFSPNGRWVATGSHDGTARIHWVLTADLLAEATARMHTH
jgi:Trypsin-like peptidase domain/WD domain, G-beta repeat